ncbi:MAG TPA: CocE/NonD family hydrolase, partial [Acidobacteriaceae bacterium]|nr:CocE/NonD family hydrolase [Acidobacteriaceae bacterium]
MTKTKPRRILAAGLLVGLGVAEAQAQKAEPVIPDPAGVQDEAPPSGYTGPRYTREEVMIPVRDGVKLHTVIYRPQGSAKTGDPLPFLMQRTPYGVNSMTARAIESGKPELA